MMKEITRADILREAVRARMTADRFAHTLGVERMATELGELYLPGKLTELRAAALLHDVTKCETLEKQLQYCAEFDIMIRMADRETPAVFHEITGAAVAEREFPEYATPDVVSAVRWHATGREGMTLFDSLIYLADYIEEGRIYPDCVRTRDFFRDAEPSAMEKAERLRHLYRTLAMTAEQTLMSLAQKGAPIHPDTERFRDFCLNQLRESDPGTI